MAVIKKTLFPKNLDKFAVLVNDTQSDSKYFKITELPDTFTGGKNAFLIAGSEYLVPDTKIQIELKSSDGNIIYHEPGEGLISSSIGGEAFVTEYYEGVSKVVAVYIYPDTSYGPCTLTILGELSEYEDGNGIMTPVPLDWEGKYNVKWQKQIDVNPSLPNITKIRFYRRPTPTINELVEPIYRIETGSKVPTGVNQSFADIKLSNLETFAGDVKRVKVFRTSEGTISDYDLIQDILVESKELLTSFGLSGSVVGNTGIFTQETLKNYWNTGSLTTQLTSSRVESGLKLNGSGLLTYTTSLDLKSANTYELNLDAFYSSSTKSNLGLWVSYVSQSTTFSSSIGTLYGLNPTTNLLDSTFPFKIDRDYPTASLYLSQSQGEWHVGNISLKLSQDTAFSPDEISFITTMPTVVGNETFNFKFEFYDVNNNYVPVAVTQSVLFTGGTTSSVDVDFIISSSLSQSLDALYTVSSSISGTVTFNSSSISGSLTNVSSSISGSITTLSGSVSQSVALTLSSSLSKVQQLANGQYSGSFIGDTVIYSPTLGGQQGYISELFKVGTSPSIYLDARQNPRKIFIGGVSDSGSYNNSNTNVYMDSTGKFSLGNKLSWDGTGLSINGSITATAGAIGGINISTNKIYVGTGTYANSNTGFYLDSSGNFSLKDKLTWDSGTSTLSVNGSITITGGNAATTTYANSVASTAESNAISTAASDATSKANTAQTNAINTAAADATSKANTAFTNAKAVADSIANGTYSGGTLITGTSVISPVIAGTSGYFSNKFQVGNTNPIVLDASTSTRKIYVGTGTYANSNTGVYLDGNGQFSLKDKLTWNGTTLSVEGTINATAGNFSGNIAAATGQIGSWTIDGGNLRNGTNRLILDPTTPSIRLKDSSLSDKTIFRTGPLSTISALTLSVPGNTVSIPTTSRNTAGSTDTGKVYSGIQSLATVNASNYEKSITLNTGTGTAISIDANTGAYVNVSFGYDIINSSGTVIDTVTFRNISRSSPGGSSGAVSVDWGGSTTQVYSISFPAFDTYSINSWYRIQIQHTGGSGAATVGALSTSTPTATYDKINTYTEITEQGIQVVSSLTRYVRISTNQATDADALYVNGSFTATSKSFKITHPLDENKWLFHSTIEGPRVDNLYRGTINLIKGFAEVNLDLISNMTEGTWVKLNRDGQFFLQNMNGWDRVKGELNGNILSIYCENKNSTDLISYMVISERCDDEVKQLEITDDDGKLIPEILKEIK